MLGAFVVEQHQVPHRPSPAARFGTTSLPIAVAASQVYFSEGLSLLCGGQVGGWGSFVLSLLDSR